MSFESIPYFDSQNSDFIPPPNIRPPFPPTFITVSDFVNKRESSSRIFRKSPNAFFIYRKAFTNHLTFLNYKLTMIDVSKLVSNYWKNESKEVKEAYAEIAKKIDVELKEKRKHDKKCPVIWKSDKKSKKQKRVSRKNSNNNDSTNNSLTKFRNTTEIPFGLQDYPIPVNNEPSNHSQTSLESSPISTPPLMGYPGIVQGYNVINYDNSYECQSNESEEETHELYNLNICDQNLNQIYNSSGYNNFVNYDNLFNVPLNWNMNNLCINDNANLASEFH
ncbi:hypothetical protein RclHR1_01720029 [Rhizophagus clarus]|uniref:HMG box domain-containing protein n=1 Tax=Rhizophagus clarus TaxID=94130 RepID=A0A2Z6RCL3_9GLOM|nr:hypothetical protein RclHR1_01720029 [Rhizophagus clarus]GES99579.1 hypothetical protein GLOIN_2v1541740 [Rhizophagus clarus]